MAEPDSPQPSDEPLSQRFSQLHLWQIQAVRDSLVIAAVVLVIWIGYEMSAVTVPLLVALLLAYLFDPLIEWVTSGRDRWRISRARAVGLLLLVVGGAVVIVLALAIPLVVGQTTQFVRDVSDGTMRKRIARLEPSVPVMYQQEFDSIIEFLPAGDAEPAADVDENVSGLGESPEIAEDDQAASATLSEERVRDIVAEQLEAMQAEAAPAAGDDFSTWLYLQRGMEAIWSILAATIQIGLLVFLIPFYFFFFSLWYPSVVRFGRELIPLRNRQRSFELLRKMDHVVAGFVRGRIVISFIMGVLLAIGWWLCGVPYAIVLGLVIGIFCAVPYLGGVGVPLAVGLLFFEQLGLPAEARMAWWQVLLWPTVVFVAVQLLEGYVLTPMIAGKVTNLDPVTIIVAVLAGGTIMGVYGMLLAIPLAACGKILLTEVLMPHVRDWIEGRARDPLPFDQR